MGGEGSGRKKKTLNNNSDKAGPSKVKGGLTQQTLAFGQRPRPTASAWTTAPATEKALAPLAQPASQVNQSYTTDSLSQPSDLRLNELSTLNSMADIHKSLSLNFQTGSETGIRVQQTTLHDLEDQETDSFIDEDEDGSGDEEGLDFYGTSDPNDNDQREREAPTKCEKDWPKLEKGTPLFQYVESVVAKLKQQMGKSGKVDCYEHRTFWIHPGESAFDRLKGNEPFSYYRDCLLDIFVWIPHLLVTVNCPWCGTEATNSGFAHNPTGRIISGFRNYVLVSYAYECKQCPKWGGKKKHFYGSSKACLDTLEAELAGCFTAILTKKGGIDREFADFFMPCFMSGMGPQKFAAAARETVAKRKDRKELNWIMAVNRRISGGRTVVDMLTGKTPSSLKAEVPEYPDYNSDFVPSGNYFRVSQQASKRLLRMHGTSIFPALLSFMNNHEEFVGFVLCPSKAQSHWRPLFQNVSDCILENGYKPVQVMYTDNPSQDKRICEEAFPSLRVGVVDREERELSKLPRFQMDENVTVEFYNDFGRIQTFASDIILAFNERAQNVPFYIHLDAEWNVNPGQAPGKIAVIQIGFELRIGILMVYKLQSLPSNLLSIMKSTEILKVGKQVGGDVAKILRDFGHSPTISGTLELGRYLKDRGLIENAGIGLQKMVAQILKKHLPKDDELRLSNWEQLLPNSPQFDYAANDINASQKLFTFASTYPRIGDPLSNPKAGDKVSLFSLDKRRRVAEGIFISQQNERALITITHVLVSSAHVSLNGRKFGSLTLPCDIEVDFGLLVARSPKEKNITTIQPQVIRALEPENRVFLEEDTTIDALEEDEISGTTVLDDVPLTGLLDLPPIPANDMDSESLAFGRVQFENIMSVEGETLYTRVLGDPFHLLKSVKVSKFHSLSYDFAIALANSVIIRLEEPKQALIKRLEELDLDFKQVLRSNRKEVLKCIPGVIPEASIVAKAWREVCETYGPRLDPKYGPLFSKSNWKEASLAYKQLLSGQYSDPPGIQLYRKCGQHPVWKVSMYHCSRGTVSNEGTAHKQALDTFSSYNLGPMAFTSAMQQLALRSTIKNGTKHRTGAVYSVAHYDLGLGNRLHGAYTTLGLKLPTRFENWINTDFYTVPNGRRIGILEIPHEDREKYKMDAASFKFSTNLNSRTFIAREQGLKHAALPVLTKEERELFKEMVLRQTRKDYELMAAEWNQNPLVDGKLVTYKLPEHLSAYHSILKDREREQESLFIAGEQRRQLAERLSTSTIAEAFVPLIASPKPMEEYIVTPEFGPLTYQYDDELIPVEDSTSDIVNELDPIGENDVDEILNAIVDANPNQSQPQLEQEGHSITATPSLKSRGAKFCFLTQLANGAELDEKGGVNLKAWETGFKATHLKARNENWEMEWSKNGEGRARRRLATEIWRIAFYYE
ncbi:hypothetical protein BCR33DRAFT_738525 [Rhizoclosmatium globosum]|uniref:3'-5' exonuclease n=1 Tax=Rhizoclosmatium globosum TaxID=329046 RepID=A0A1Y2C9V1_9FUNG|nr:hypothetical protein BCR33DRAFT_738525 [Rhizoclosmatium globosum]|eukprot:ORY43811.1 hypothetical protein BCR33DRAFT_738525 [Rhizoclosmatium globosum]